MQVYEWMINRPERFRMTTSDTAIQLDLISKVQGISAAEEYFLKLPDGLKDNRIYGSLLNAYVHAKMKEEAESLIGKMRNRGYANNSLPFNVMMTLYMNLRDYDKVDSMVFEMMEKRIPLDIYTYNIWLSSCGSRGSLGKMEQAYKQMEMDTSINPNWTTFSTMATSYIKLKQPEKAEDCLKKLESRITGRDRIPYHYLISLYGSVDNKDEVLRVWNIYKSLFPNVPNLGYHAVISSLVRMDDIEAAEEIYESWLAVKSTYDPRIANLLLAWYVRKGLADKAESFFNEIIEVGGKPNSMTWEILAESHIRDRKISEALSCLKNATEALGSKSWKPKPANVSLLLKLCKQEGDTLSKEALMEILKKMGCLENEQYMSNILLSDESFTSNGSLTENSNSDDDEDAAEVLLSQQHGIL
ncbi:hypothetical protein LIER_33946 [Lithospermum erythrorhizon]|uniref:Pentatricopeptide repeat-containing protein n=1 Tax=Lithospermum erythrorhizon TaxID=34254 RepID=A0AAV3RY33_LITER